MAEHATESAGKVDEKKESKASSRYTHASNSKKPNESGKMAEGGEGSPKHAGSGAEGKGDGAGGSPLKEMHTRHAASHDAMDAKHKGERESLHAEHEKNLAKHGSRPDVHATHHEQRTRQHRHHADEKRALNDQHTMDHLQAAGIHGGAGLAGSPEGATAGQGGAGMPSPSGTPVAAGMGGGAPGGAQAAAGQPQSPMPGAPAAAMA